MGENKDKKVIAIGASLVILVALLTFARPLLNRKTEPAETTEDTSQDFKYTFISAEDLMQKKQSQPNTLLIDTRPADQFQQEHILGSLNADQETIQSYLEKISPTNELILLSANSNDVSLKLMAETLRSQGRENFAILSGGLLSWTEAGGRTIRVGDPNLLSDQAKISIVKPEELKSALDQKDPKLFILDLRSLGQYASGHLPQAQNIPASDLEVKFSAIPSGKNIVYYGASELETFQLGVTLFDLGLTRSSALEGGIEAWKAKGFTIEK